MDEEQYENEENEKFIYPNLFGLMNLTDNTFNHKNYLGNKCLQYKPEKIIFWLGEKKKQNILSGVEITYRNIIDGSKIEYNNSIGIQKKDKFIFKIKPTEYLINFKIWLTDDGINKVYLQTNKGNDISVGENDTKDEIFIDEFKEPQIILFFRGNYNNYLTAFSPILINKIDYIKILFEGYFMLKAFLRKEDKRNEILKQMEEGKFKGDEIALIKVCLLSDNPFNGIIKYCIV